MKAINSGAVIRGRYIEDDLVSFGGRVEGVEFFSPDPYKLIDHLPLGSGQKMADLYEISFEEIVDYLQELGDNLALEKNAYMQEALDALMETNPLTPPILTAMYQSLPSYFNRNLVREVAEQRIGIDKLEGWAKTTLGDGRELSIRAFGSRALHIIAGNGPAIACFSIMRNAITRSDAIIKSPSNDPFTALGIARTMIDMAPDHPLTKHLSVAYWKGGDENFEKVLYQPANVEKIIAWGGFASVKHVTRYIQPGLELISLDPKRSASLIGEEGLQDEAIQKEVAKRLATDIGTANQEGCVSARVIYVQSGTDEEGLERLNQFGRHVYEALLNLPEHISTKPKAMDTELKSHVASTSLQDDWYKVFGGENDEGAVIVSQIPEAVEFSALLANRVANLVPIDSVDEIFDNIDSYTQTIGIYPDSLKKTFRDKLPLFGAQRLISLGYAAAFSLVMPQDGIEPLRRMCKWITDEDCDPEKMFALWRDNYMGT